jgi:hypothetical protein
MPMLILFHVLYFLLADGRWGRKKDPISFSKMGKI